MRLYLTNPLFPASAALLDALLRQKLSCSADEQLSVGSSLTPSCLLELAYGAMAETAPPTWRRNRRRQLSDDKTAIVYITLPHLGTLSPTALTSDQATVVAATRRLTSLSVSQASEALGISQARALSLEVRVGVPTMLTQNSTAVTASSVAAGESPPAAPAPQSPPFGGGVAQNVEVNGASSGVDVSPVGSDPTAASPEVVAVIIVCVVLLVLLVLALCVLRYLYRQGGRVDKTVAHEAAMNVRSQTPHKRGLANGTCEESVIMESNAALTSPIAGLKGEAGSPDDAEDATCASSVSSSRVASPSSPSMGEIHGDDSYSLFLQQQQQQQTQQHPTLLSPAHSRTPSAMGTSPSRDEISTISSSLLQTPRQPAPTPTPNAHSPHLLRLMGSTGGVLDPPPYPPPLQPSRVAVSKCPTSPLAPSPYRQDWEPLVMHPQAVLTQPQLQPGARRPLQTQRCEGHEPRPPPVLAPRSPASVSSSIGRCPSARPVDEHGESEEAIARRRAWIEYYLTRGEQERAYDLGWDGTWEEVASSPPRGCSPPGTSSVGMAYLNVLSRRQPPLTPGHLLEGDAPVLSDAMIDLALAEHISGAEISSGARFGAAAARQRSNDDGSRLYGEPWSAGCARSRSQAMRHEIRQEVLARQYAAGGGAVPGVSALAGPSHHAAAHAARQAILEARNAAIDAEEAVDADARQIV